MKGQEKTSFLSLLTAHCSLIKIFSVIIIYIFSISIDKAQSTTEELKKELIFYSDKLSVKGENTFVLDGKALLIYKDFTLESDYLLIDLKNSFIKAKGNVRAINGDVQIHAEELEIDIQLESVKIKKSKTNINNLVKFEAEELFIIQSIVSIRGFRFRDEDTRHPLRYSFLVDKLNIFPFWNYRYFYLQIEDINGDLFNSGKILPLGFPYLSLFQRNPTIPQKYINQRRIRGFVEPGSYYLRVGSDGYRGPWANFTLAYYSSNVSNGFLTAEYGLFSNVELSVYHDLADNKGNLLQFSGVWNQYDRYLKTSNGWGMLNFLHDWEYDTLSARVALNQNIGTIFVNRLPEVSLTSIFRKENYTGIQYKYDLTATRYVTSETKDNKTQNNDVGRLRLIADVNSPKFFLNDKIYFQLLTEGTAANYSFNSWQYSINGQLQMTHSLFDFLEYSLRYRQRNVFGKSPLSFDNLTDNKYAGIQTNFWISDFIEVGVFCEYNIMQNNFGVNVLGNYNSDNYSLSVLFDVINLTVDANLKLINF